jgi:hypothetical protein
MFNAGGGLMSAGRRDEPGQTARSDRFNCNGHVLPTREGVDVGPTAAARAEIKRDVEELIKNSHLIGEALGVLRDFILEVSYTLGRPLNAMIADDGEQNELERPEE